MLPRGLLKEYARLLQITLRALDAFAIAFAGWVAYAYKFGNVTLPHRYVMALIISVGFTWVIFHFFQIYESVRAKGAWQYIRSVIQAGLTVMAFLAGLAFLTKKGEAFSREWFIEWVIFALLLLVLFRCALLLLLRIMRAHGWNEKRILLIGAGRLGQKITEKMRQDVWTGFKVTAIFDDSATDGLCIGDVKVTPTPADLHTFLAAREGEFDEIWLALPLHAEHRVKAILYALRHHTITIRYALDIFGLGSLKHSMVDIDGFPMLNLNASPMVGINRLIKAIEDRLFAALILTAISPLLVFIALGVKFNSRGPVLFKQRRHGWDGRVIKIYKFRTMVVHEEEKGRVTQATLHDERITPFGKFLRKTSLDELPQFINVLQGRMSIVGPRPHALAHNEFYKESIDAYMQRHKVKPGITGWAQVNGWRGETDTLEKMQKRIEFDLHYIENWSLLLDIQIILLTFVRGFVGKNAY